MSDIFLNRESVALLLVDHQAGLLSGVRDIKTAELKSNLISLIRALNILNIPIVVTNVAPQMWGPLLPEVAAEIPSVKVIERSVVNAWDEPKVVDAVSNLGRKQLLVAGISLEVCAAFPALSAKRAGFDARVVTDASGTFNEAKRETGLARLSLAGVQIVDHATVITELLHDNADPLAGSLYEAMDMDFSKIVAQLKSGT